MGSHSIFPYFFRYYLLQAVFGMDGPCRTADYSPLCILSLWFTLFSCSLIFSFPHQFFLHKSLGYCGRVMEEESLHIVRWEPSSRFLWESSLIPISYFDHSNASSGTLCIGGLFGEVTGLNWCVRVCMICYMNTFLLSISDVKR